MEKQRDSYSLELAVCSFLSIVGAAGAFSQLIQYGLHKISWFEWYFAVLLFACAVFFTFEAWKRRRFQTDYIWFGALFFLIVVFQSRDLHKISIWIDEDFQIWTSLFQLPVEAGFWQHQPPLHFAVLGGWLNIFEPTEVTTRCWSLFFSGLSGAFLFYYIKKFSGSWWPTLFLLPVYLAHPFIVRYSYEVRPISLGLMAMTVWFGIFYDHWKNTGLKSAYILVALTFLVSVSLGFQPMALGLAFVLSIWTLPGHSLHLRFRLSGYLAAGFILFLPIQWIIIRNSPPRLDRVSHFSFTRFLEGFQLDKFTEIFLFYFWPLFPALFISILLGFLFGGRNVFKAYVRDIFLFVSIIVFSVFFITVPFFNSYVEWNMNVYYFLFLWPILLITVGVFFVFSFSTEKLPSVSVLTFAVILFLLVGNSTFFRTLQTFQESRSDIRSALSYSVETARDGGEILILPICGGSAVEWCPNWLIGKDVYLNQKVISGLKISFPSLDVPKFFTEYFLHKRKVNKIVWIYQSDWSKLPLEPVFFQKHPRYRGVVFDAVTVVVQESESADSRMDIVRALREFESYSSSSGKDAFWLRTLLAIAYHQMGDSAESVQWYNQIKDIKGSADVTNFLDLYSGLEKNH